MPLNLSIIIPVYNVAPYLKACLDTVFAAIDGYVAAGGGRCEVICVDDGSTDGSASLLDDYVSGFSNSQTSKHHFRVLHQPNRGVSAARNAALEIATGDYVIFVDGDDGLCSGALNALAKIAEASQADLIRYGHESVVDVAVRSGSSDEPRFRKIDLFDQVGGLIAWNGCYRRAVIGELRFVEGLPNGEDILFGAEFVCRAKSAVATGAKLYQYRRRAGSAVRTESLRHVLSVCEVAKRMGVGAVGQWARSHGAVRRLGRKLRAELVGEGLARIGRLPVMDRQAAWTAFFDALKVCAWSLSARIVSATRSKLIAYVLLLGDQRLCEKLMGWAIVRRLRRRG